jgi:hypothetical protein
VESAQTVIWEPSFWATEANDGEPAACGLDEALEHPARRAPTAARPTAADLRLVRWRASTITVGDLIVLPFSLRQG